MIIRIEKLPPTNILLKVVKVLSMALPIRQYGFSILATLTMEVISKNIGHLNISLVALLSDTDNNDFHYNYANI